MAASTSSTISNNITTMSTSATQAGGNGPTGQKMPASEVGWLFVHEYYTFLNKDPSRLHCFYGQKSTLIHGTEGETVTSSQGEKEIKDKFQALNLENCRVLVTNVDTQASINGGILIQVLGEMSNRNEVARKFVQTFFLDEQPNGQLNCYYVLNDIIRFLSDDDIEVYSGEEAGVSTSPTGTLVEEPINTRVEQAVPPQNKTITEPAQVVSRAVDANIPASYSKETKENEILLRTAPVNGEVINLDDDNRLNAFALESNANTQPPKLMSNGQPIQSRPPILSNVQDHSGQTVNMNKQESTTTLTSQEAHVNGQTYQISQLTPVVSTNIQPPAVASKQESASILASTESQSLQSLQSLLQENNDQATDNAVASSISKSFPVEQDKNGQSMNISKQVPAQSPTVNVSQRVVKTPITSGVQPQVIQNKNGRPTNIPKQIPSVDNSTLHLRTNNDVQISSSVATHKSHPIPNNNTQSQSVDISQVQANTKPEIDNNIQLSLSRQKSSLVVQDNNNGQTANIAPLIKSQPNDLGKPISPESSDVTQSSSVVNSKGHRVNMNTVQADKRKNEQYALRSDVTGVGDLQKLSDSHHNSQAQASTKKTWASLAANEPEKWSSSALAEAKGVVASVPAKSAVPQQMRDNRDRGQKNNSRRNSDTSLSIYVKGVTPSMSYEQLKAAFMVFGQVKHLDVVHTKSCAFVEYNNAESYRRALEVHTVEVGNETVNTEERRPARRNNGKASRGRF